MEKNLKQTVLFASKKLAKEVSDNLMGSKKFVRTEIEDGFEIWGLRGLEKIIVFRYTGAKSGRHVFQYDPRLLTF